MTTHDDRPSLYYDTESIAAGVAESRHRDMVGGMWDEIGRLQFDFLRGKGLQPASRLIDIGCGCLRGGHHFVAFLNPGNYHGTDINQSLLDAGYDIELRRRDLEARLPRANLICDGGFAFERFNTQFDFGLAQSLFTHLRLSHLRTCLANLAPRMAPCGVFFATFFLVSDDHPADASFTHHGGVVTFSHRDPYHHRISDIAACAGDLSWSTELIGDWGHPWKQQMVQFTRDPDERQLSPSARPYSG